MDKAIERIRENIALSDEKPYFADEVMVLRTVKSSGEKKKEGYLEFVFIDMTNQKPVSKIVVSPGTARAFAAIISKELEQLDREIKSKVKKQPKQQENENTYIG